MSTTVQYCHAFNRNGSCTRGDQCTYSHTIAPQGAIPPPRNNNFNKNYNNYNNSSSNVSQGFTSQSNGKHGYCFAFPKGLCDKGDDCQFSHVMPQPVTTNSGFSNNFNTNTNFNTNQNRYNSNNQTSLPRYNNGNYNNFNNNPSSNPVRLIGYCHTFIRTRTCERGDECQYKHEDPPKELLDAYLANQNNRDNNNNYNRMNNNMNNNYNRNNNSNNFNKPYGFCFNFLKNGTCENGNSCTYSHDTPTNTNFNNNYNNQNRYNNNNQFQDNNNLPLGTCFAFAKGTCTNGENCKYKHVTPQN